MPATVCTIPSTPTRRTTRPKPTPLRSWFLVPWLAVVSVRPLLRWPMAVGVKVTLKVQVPLTARIEGIKGQLFVCPKSVLLTPLIAMLVMLSAVLPELVSVRT